MDLWGVASKVNLFARQPAFSDGTLNLNIAGVVLGDKFEVKYRL